MKGFVRSTAITVMMVAAVVLTNEAYRAMRDFFVSVQKTSDEVTLLREEVRQLRGQGSPISGVQSVALPLPSPVSVPRAAPLPLPLPPLPVGASPARNNVTARLDDGAEATAVVLASDLKSAPAASTLNVKLLGDEK